MPTTPQLLPSALDEFAQIVKQVGPRRIAVFLDYDGTLTPIVDTPDQAIMAEDMRNAVVKLAQTCPVGIISGRDRKDVMDKAGIKGIVYAGSHGFDISGPEDLQAGNQIGRDFLPILDTAEQELTKALGSIEGLLVERKKYAIAVHYRLVAPEETRATIEKVVDATVARHPKLRKALGKKIFELQPNVDWHKGKALLALLKSLKLESPEVTPFYIGDDVTDEDAFAALHNRGIGIVVWEKPHPTAATYSLQSTDEVREFLVKLTDSGRRSA